ncbi:hypothetical protein SDC9_33822 [bioreactor metagenome]|uniref:Uncharacterized protein n=1 Tax=bioreactor metagenome TaxID=1076179 RepID=A0A644VAQ2_9ZZZZ
MPEARHVSGGPGSTQDTVNGLYHPFKSLGDIQNGKGNENAEPGSVDKHGCGLEGLGQFRFLHHHGVYLTADTKDFRSDGEPEGGPPPFFLRSFETGLLSLVNFAKQASYARNSLFSVTIFVFIVEYSGFA